MVLITGATGMLGRYMAEQFSDSNLKTLGRSVQNDFCCDLSKDTPEFNELHFDAVVHCAGTETDSLAEPLNHQGTLRLIDSLSANPPKYFVYISSYRVYSRDAGENVTEDTNTWASDETGMSKARAEEALIKWASENGITLTIVRPARMFGNGVSGDSLILFNDAVNGKFIHIRGNDARLSIVTALDVARAVKEVYKQGGIYNAADGVNPRLIDLVEAMTANSGSLKRMTHLPATWAEWMWRLGRWIPFINRNLNPEVVENRMKTLTLDGTKLSEVSGFRYYDTLDVISRQSNDYPYSEGAVKRKEAIYEA